MRFGRNTFLLTVLAMGLFIGGVIIYPLIKNTADRLRGHIGQTFIDTTDAVHVNRHHSGPAWLGSFSVSAVDFDRDGHVDIFVNNHERNRPYFYRNNGKGGFIENHEAIGLWENSIGPVFGKPKMDKPGIYLWLEPKIAIDGTWHLRWLAEAGHGVSGEITTNTWFKSVRPVSGVKDEMLDKQRGRLRFEVSTNGQTQGLDFNSGFPESTLFITLSFDGQPDTSKVFIGPQGVQPKGMPFELSLGDRHATVWGDYDNDGRADLFVTRGAMVGFLRPPFVEKHEELFRNIADGRVDNVVEQSNIRNGYGRGRDAQWMDFDGDGHLDLYVSNIGSRNLLFRNRGDGTFDEVGEKAGLNLLGPTHFVFADFNGDGNCDVLFSQPLRLFTHQGDGTFREESEAWGLVEAEPFSYTKDSLFWGAEVTVADFDNDGDLDVFAAGGKGGATARLLENNKGRFIDITTQAGLLGLKDTLVGLWGDYDNDGHMDLYIVSTDPGSNRLFKNNGNKTFTDLTQTMNLGLTGRYEWAMPAHAGGVATWVDYDSDGFLDLFLTTRRPDGGNEGDSVWQSILASAHGLMKGKTAGTHFLMKNTGNGNNWVRIELVGNSSNRDGYGAKVYVTTKSGTQFQEAGAVGKIRYAQNRLPLHFGLGPDNRVGRIEIVWPSGRVQHLNDVGVGQTVRIEEPKG